MFGVLTCSCRSRASCRSSSSARSPTSSARPRSSSSWRSRVIVIGVVSVLTRGPLARPMRSPAADPHAVDPIASALRPTADADRPGRPSAHGTGPSRRTGADPSRSRTDRRPVAAPAGAATAADPARRPSRPDRPRLTRRWRASRSCSPAGRSARRSTRSPAATSRSSTARRSWPGRPGWTTIADVVAIDRGRTPASHFTFPDLLEIAGRPARRRSRTRRSTARSSSRARTRSRRPRFCWDLVLDGPKPVVVTGAMRASDEAGFDGPANLRDAVRVAAAAVDARRGRRRLPGRHDRAGRRRDQDARLGARHVPAARTAARSGGSTADERRALPATRRPAPRRGPTRAAERVHLITATVAMDGSLLDAAVAAGARRDRRRRDRRGQHGSGACWPPRTARSPPGSRSPSRRAARRVAPARPTPSRAAEREWVRAGALPVGHLCAVKARVALALGLGAGLDRDGLGGAARRPGRPDAVPLDMLITGRIATLAGDARVRLGRGDRDPRRAVAFAGSEVTSRPAPTRSPSGSPSSPTRWRSRA